MWSSGPHAHGVSELLLRIVKARGGNDSVICVCTRSRNMSILMAGTWRRLGPQRPTCIYPEARALGVRLTPAFGAPFTVTHIPRDLDGHDIPPIYYAQKRTRISHIRVIAFTAVVREHYLVTGCSFAPLALLMSPPLPPPAP